MTSGGVIRTVAGTPAHVIGSEFTGNKASILSLLSSRGLNVPPGLAITGVESALLATNIAAIPPPPDRRSALEHEAADLRSRVSVAVAAIAAPFGYAVRSSGTSEDGEDKSHAGIFDSVVGVALAAVPAAVTRVSQSGASDRSRQYTKGPLVPASIPVLIQPMIAARCAGVVFSRDPLSFGSGKVTIEAVAGLADGLLAGTVEPDAYVLDRTGRRELTVQIVRQRTATTLVKGGGMRAEELAPLASISRKLRRSDVQDVLDAALAIEEILGPGQDIEFAFDARGLHILQARPITGTTKHEGD